MKVENVFISARADDKIFQQNWIRVSFPPPNNRKPLFRNLLISMIYCLLLRRKLLKKFSLLILAT